MNFSSKIDAWLVVVLGVAFALTVWASLESVLKTKQWIGGFPVVIFAVVLLLVISTRYTLEDNELLVRSGVMKWHVPYGDPVGRTDP